MLTLVYCGVLKKLHRTLKLKMRTRNAIDVFYQEKKTKLISEQGFMSYGNIYANYGKNAVCTTCGH
jgi:hypothetical protein